MKIKDLIPNPKPSDFEWERTGKSLNVFFKGKCVCGFGYWDRKIPASETEKTQLIPYLKEANI